MAWKVGDRIPINATIWTKNDGGRTWEFDIEGIFENENSRGSAALFLFNYDYFDESRAFGQGLVGWYILRVASGADPVQVRNAVDLQFENSPNQTETSTEAAFAQSFAEQLGNIALIVTLVYSAPCSLPCCSSRATRCRNRFASVSPNSPCSRQLGFGDRTVLGIVLSESILIMLIGGLLGIGVGWVLARGVAGAIGAFLPGFYFSPMAALAAVGLMIGGGFFAGIFPALQAMRLSIIDALARA